WFPCPQLGPFRKSCVANSCRVGSTRPSSPVLMAIRRALTEFTIRATESSVTSREITMKSTATSGSIVGRHIVLPLCLVFCLLAEGTAQSKKPSSSQAPKQSPPPHASAPPHASGGNAQRPGGNGQGNRPGGPGNNAGNNNRG